MSAPSPTSDPAALVAGGPEPVLIPALPPSPPPHSGGTVLVTGGTGLYGSALAALIASSSDPLLATEQWVFLSSKDGDLRDRAQTFACM